MSATDAPVTKSSIFTMTTEGGVPSNVTTEGSNSSFLNDQDVRNVHITFAVITMLYIPFIVINNNLVLWSTLLFRKLHTPHNLMLSSLAIADLIMGVYCIPMYALSYISSTQYLITDSGKYVCLAWFASHTIGGAGSLNNLLLISIDRYIAVMYPLYYHKIMTMKVTTVAIFVLWIYVIIMTMIPSLGWNNYDPSIQDHNKRCNYYTVLPEEYVVWASFFTTAVSIIIPFFLNIKIFYTVYKQQRSLRMYEHLWSAEQIKRFRERVQTVRISAVLFILFIIFWLPFMLVAPLKYTDLSPKSVEMIKVNVQLLYFLNAAINPPIYALMKTEYKIAYWLLLSTPVCQWTTLKHHSLSPDTKENSIHRSVNRSDADGISRPSAAVSSSRHYTTAHDSTNGSFHNVTSTPVDEDDYSYATTPTAPPTAVNHMVMQVTKLNVITDLSQHFTNTERKKLKSGNEHKRYSDCQSFPEVCGNGSASTAITSVTDGPHDNHKYAYTSENKMTEGPHGNYKYLYTSGDKMTEGPNDNHKHSDKSADKMTEGPHDNHKHSHKSGDKMTEGPHDDHKHSEKSGGKTTRYVRKYFRVHSGKVSPIPPTNGSSLWYLTDATVKVETPESDMDSCEISNHQAQPRDVLSQHAPASSEPATNHWPCAHTLHF